jgi:hypothetical protein
MIFSLIISLKFFNFNTISKINLLKGKMILHVPYHSPVFACVCISYLYSRTTVFLVSSARPDAPAETMKNLLPPPSPPPPPFFWIFLSARPLGN